RIPQDEEPRDAGPTVRALPRAPTFGDALLRTKLYAPPPRSDLVPRPRLEARLDAGLRGKLTLLAAPAGFGKTTLVGAWRADPPLPLARLRAQGELAELRAADLRFTADEAAAFLTEARGLPLAAQDVAALGERTEGWVAGLHLAALSLQGRDDMAGFIAAFTGSHRHLGDYLVEEV